MKRIACAGLVVCLAGAAMAGGPVTVMDEAVVEAQTASSGSDNWVGVGLTLLVILTVLTAGRGVLPLD
jgi:hypothetical protein